MKLFTLIIAFALLGGAVHAQFDPNSVYLDYGNYEVSTYQAQQEKAHGNWKHLPYRTAAFNPTQILPGSVLFIPGLIGVRLSGGTYHDGYFFAHAANTKLGSGKIELCVEQGHNPFAGRLNEPMQVHVVRGTMAKSLRTRYAPQYEIERIKPTYLMVASEFTELMKTAREKYPDIDERIQYLSERGLGTPYLIFNLGEGAGSSPDPDPTIDFARTDCMTFCEHTLALAISTDYPQMYNKLQQIRYKDGKISYTTRNHYTIADWLPNNSWLLYDATPEIGPGLTRTMSKTIDRKSFYKNNGVAEENLADAPGPMDYKVSHIPTENLMHAAPNLKGGEIASIVTTHPAVISAHMGIIVRDEWDNLIFRHASSPPETGEVMDEKFSEVVQRLEKSKSRVGMIFMRAREDSDSY